MTPRPVAAVVFDMDGTLIDSESIYRAALVHAIEALGFVVDEAFPHSLNGLPGFEVTKRIQAEYGDDFPFDVFRARYQVRRAALAGNGIPLRPGAAEALRFVTSRGLPLALATSSTRAAATEHLGRLELLAHFTAMVTRDDVARIKPHPDIFLLAAERLGVAPRDCLAVEDSAPGVAAALAAGMMTVMVPDVVMPTPELRAACVAVHASLHDLPGLFPDPGPAD